MTRKRFARLILLACAACWCAAMVQPIPAEEAATTRTLSFDEVISSFDKEVASAVEKDGGGCVIVGVFRGDKMLWSKGYGWEDIENRIPATPETISRVGSISKPMTAVVMMQTVERGVIDLDDPVRDYFSEIENLADPPADMEPITFRMLASHTAGLEREPDLPDAASGPIENWEAKVIESISKTSFRTPPLTEHYYSNIGYGILGLATSRAAERPFMEMVTKDIFEPLNMTDSTFIIKTDEMKNRLAVGYIRNRETGELSSEFTTREHLGRGYKVPNGGVYSTVDDLRKFAAGMMGIGPNQILTPESRREIFSPQPSAERYGLGFRLYEMDQARIVGHRGAIAGYNADLRFDLDSQLGVAMLRTTSYNPPTEGLLNELLEADSIPDEH